MQSDTEESLASPADQSAPSSPPAPTLERDFLLLYRDIPQLWDTKHPHYTNKYKRNNNLEKLLPIVKQMKANATLQDVKNKVNSLRSNYRREIKKIEASKRTAASFDEIYCPKIWYFPYLHFLSKLEDQNENIADEQTNDPQNKQHKPVAKIECEQRERSFSSKTKIRPSTPPRSVKKKAKREVQLDRSCQYLAEPCSRPNQPQNVPNPIALDWGNTLDRLEPMQRLYAKKAINDVLFEAELGNLRKDSVKINESYAFYPSSSALTTSSPPTPHSPIQQTEMYLQQELTHCLKRESQHEK